MNNFRFARTALQALAPEAAHRLTVRALASGFVSGSYPEIPEILATEVAGLTLESPIGLAAGFDKNAETVTAMASFGFGFVEVGTVTPFAQAGNPKPRMFRLPKDQAVINRLGFNNEGMAEMERRLNALPKEDRPVLGVNVGANKDSADRVKDYIAGVEKFEPLADYLTINISSPNTPGLRDLQSVESLRALLSGVAPMRKANKPLFVKIAPDIADEDLPGIVRTAIEEGVTGLIISNTTISRPELKSTLYTNEPGGLSGPPVFARSTELLAKAYSLAEERLVLIGVGGVSNGADAYAKIRAGANLVQLYTALAYHGPSLVNEIHVELAGLLARDGFATVADAVGADVR